MCGGVANLLGALQAWNAYGAQYISVPSDENGMIMDKLERRFVLDRSSFIFFQISKILPGLL